MRECIHSLHIACRDIGFLGLTGHNISKSLRKETLEVSRQFFAQDESEKNKIHISNYQNCIGYQHLGQNVTQNKRDQHEGIDIYKTTHNASHAPFNVDFAWPAYPHSFESVFADYIAECLQLGQTVMSAIALSLHLPSTYFDNKCDESFYVLRVLHYPLHDDIGNEFGEWGCGEHRDYGCLTFINCDNTSDCLEVQNCNGIFGKVNVNTVDDDCFIVNLGDMLNLWSGGLYQSTLHRVLPPKRKNVCKESIKFNERNVGKDVNEIGRISVPFFYEPNWETMIEPIQFNMDDGDKWSNEDKLKWKEMEGFRKSNVQPVMYGDHLKGKVLSNFGY